MIQINKGNQPSELLQHKKSNIEGITPNFENMGSGCKDSIRAKLFQEQKGICAYCNQILKSKTKIEHHCEQSICDGTNGSQDKRLDFSNMLLVCDGNPGKNQHCDSKKSEFNISNGLPITINPLNQHHINTIGYKKSGIMYSNNNTYNTEINEILGLNQSRLKILRQKKHQSLLKILFNKSGKKNVQRFKTIIQMENDCQIFKTNFPGIGRYLLERYCQ